MPLQFATGAVSADSAEEFEFELELPSVLVEPPDEDPVEFDDEEFVDAPGVLFFMCGSDCDELAEEPGDAGASAEYCARMWPDSLVTVAVLASCAIVS
jgi:hypothetical protein